MKNKKMKILTAVVIVLVILIAGSLIYISQRQNTAVDDTAEKDADISLKVDSYTSYHPENADFAYMIAVIESDSGETVSLSHFTTSDGVRLDQVSDYLSILRSQNVDVDSMDLAEELTRGKSNIFIPVKDKDADKIEVSSDLNGVKTMTFNLEKETASPEPTASEEPSAEPSETTDANTVIAEQGDNKIAVSNIFEIDPASCLQNGGEAMLPSSARVYAAEIEVQNLEGDSITFENCEYDTSDGQTFQAEDSSFSSQEYTSAMGTTLHTGDKACFYFILLGNGDSDFSYEGTLKLKASGIDETVDAPVSLH